MNPDGTGDTNITNNPALESEPEFGIDGSLLFRSNRDGNNEIYRMSSLDAPPVNLTQNSASDFGARYSPDGKTIVFMTNRDGNLEIYKMNANGSVPVRVTNTPTVSEGVPAFSADGRKIIFVKLVPGGPIGMQFRPHTMNVDGSDPQPMPAPNVLSPVPAYEYFDYSPDGSKIMMTFATDAQTQFRTTWTMNSDGTNYVRFPADGKHGTYSPDGTKVVYTCCEFNGTNHLKRSDAVGNSGSIVDLTPSTAGNFEPDWQPIAAPRPALFDFDGDGRSDQAIFRSSTNDWWILSSINSAQLAFNFGTATDVLAPADYDGDLKTDLAVWRPSTGNFHVLNSFNFTIRIENFGLAGDIPTGGDFDGDGKADLAVYRPGTG